MKGRRLAVFGLLALLIGSTIASHAQTFSVVYNFGSQPNDPIQPFYSGIIAQGRDGNLYSGTSAGGSTLDAGATYSMTPTGTLGTLFAFGGGDGSYVLGGLTLGSDGNFYGTTYGGGFTTLPYGTVFKLTLSGGFTNLYTFTAGTDGALPTAPPIQGTDGNLYGTTCPKCNNQPGYGTIYKITPSGIFSPLFQCDGIVCFDFPSPLVQGTDGNFYGTSDGGGTNGQGVIFRITPAGRFTVLYNFDSTHGRIPYGPLVQASDGNFYGTALAGGSHNSGVVFKMTPGGGLTVVHNMNGTTDGYSPFAGLVQATDGNLYGANSQGGVVSADCPGGCGTLFRIAPTGFKVLYDFDFTTGNYPYSTLTQHTNGILYGATQLGGTGSLDTACVVGNCGVFYSLNIGAPPFVTFVGPAVAKVGKTVEILGKGFTGTTSVSFGGATATFRVVSDTFLTATVPNGATTASVTVTTPGGTLTSNKIFRVAPQLLSFNPPSGAVGTLVNSRFTSDYTAHIVSPNAVSAINPGGFQSSWCGATGIAKLSADLTAMSNLK